MVLVFKYVYRSLSTYTTNDLVNENEGILNRSIYYVQTIMIIYAHNDIFYFQTVCVHVVCL